MSSALRNLQLQRANQLLVMVLCICLVLLYFPYYDSSQTTSQLQSQLEVEQTRARCLHSLPSQELVEAFNKAIIGKPPTAYWNQAQESVLADGSYSSLLKSVAVNNTVMLFPVEAKADFFGIVANMMVSLINANTRHFLPICATEKAAVQLKLMKIVCWREVDYTSRIPRRFRNTGSARDQFKLTERMKFQVAVEALNLGYNVTVIDTDIVFLRNPLPALQSTSADILFQSDSPIKQWNVGITHARAKTPSVKVLKAAIERCDGSPPTDKYQPCFNFIRKQNKIPVKANSLDEREFAFFSPAFEDTGRLPAGVPSRDTVTIHATWSVGSDVKYFLFREHGLWSLDLCQYYSSTTTKYIRLHVSDEQTTDEQLAVVRSGLVIGLLLNRAVILPRIDNKELHYYMAIKHIMNGYPGLVRESIFLKHISVPEAVKTSRSDTFYINSARSLSVPHGSVIRYPKDDKGPSEREIIDWFSEEKASVLELHAPLVDTSMFSPLARQREQVFIRRDDSFQHLHKYDNKQLLSPLLVLWETSRYFRFLLEFSIALLSIILLLSIVKFYVYVCSKKVIMFSHSKR